MRFEKKIIWLSGGIESIQTLLHIFTTINLVNKNQIYEKGIPLKRIKMVKITLSV